MNFLDAFGPYHPRKRGRLVEYLKEQQEGRADNLFDKPMWFFVLKGSGLLTPYETAIRVNLSPAPDTIYFVNENFLLQSNGGGMPNMSCRAAREGTYNPRDILRNQSWSAIGLNID